MLMEEKVGTHANPPYFAEQWILRSYPWCCAVARFLSAERGLSWRQQFVVDWTQPYAAEAGENQKS